MCLLDPSLRILVFLVDDFVMSPRSQIIPMYFLSFYVSLQIIAILKSYDNIFAIINT